MRESLIASSLFTLVTSIFVVSEALAECPEGKTEVTIVNRGGKVIEICIPDVAVGHIGGPSDVVIPATCPCWSTTSLDDNARVLNPVVCRIDTGCDSEADICARLIGTDVDTGLRYRVLIEAPGLTVPGNFCQFFDESNDIAIFEGSITRDQALACYEVIINSDMWVLNCESP